MNDLNTRKEPDMTPEFAHAELVRMLREELGEHFDGIRGVQLIEFFGGNLNHPENIFGVSVELNYEIGMSYDDYHLSRYGYKSLDELLSRFTADVLPDLQSLMGLLPTVAFDPILMGA